MTLAGATVGWELVAVALARVNLAVASPPVTVYKLNLNLGTVLGSPLRSQKSINLVCFKRVPKCLF